MKLVAKLAIVAGVLLALPGLLAAFLAAAYLAQRTKREKVAVATPAVVAKVEVDPDKAEMKAFSQLLKAAATLSPDQGRRMLPYVWDKVVDSPLREQNRNDAMLFVLHKPSGGVH